MYRSLFPGALIVLTVAAATLAGQQSSNPAYAPVTDVPGLPRVLILGDSISIGYTVALREALAGVANVHRPAENCRSSWYGIEKLDEWLGTGKWDVIHFNFGLHDLKHINETGQIDDPPRGKLVTTVYEYRANMEKIVERLERTGAKLIWRPTTPVPEGGKGRFAGAEVPYNMAALAVMRAHGVQVDDLNAFIADEKIPPVSPGNVHFSPESSKQMAARIAALIKAAL